MSVSWKAPQISREEVVHTLGLDRNYQGVDFLLPALGIFGAGLLVGAGLGLLFAPKSGNDLRGDIRHRAHDLRENTNHFIQDKSQSVRNRIRNPNAAPNTEEQPENVYADGENA